MPEKRKERALVAMSGGVDSAVSALLTMDMGYECHGVTMDLSVRSDSENACCTSKDVQDAASVCASLGMDHAVLSLGEEFDRRVISQFVETYVKGETPNPCILCNKHLKFGKLLEYADSLGYERIVTGHYARIEEEGGRYYLCRASDQKKDQSYVLWTLSQAQLSRVIFPLGSLTKDEVRRIASEKGFSSAAKRDSQDVCFIPDGDYVSYIEKYCGHGFERGDFLGTDGSPLGKHEGIIRYTPGQRKGLGIAFGKPMYVKSKDAATNTVTLSSNEELFESRLTARDVNLISCDGISEPMRVLAKIRYNHSPSPATVSMLDGGRIEVVFDAPQRAIASGQSVVLYDGERVVGGGIIE